ncbi:MAG: Gfo/Idh/MocA family oxidoreductase [Victivallales bacterium]|nr:Gfo/Idh/MocA family oxidoreductase [Victivallales bacterium]
MTTVKYGLIGFGGIAENRVAKEGFACDRARFAPHPTAELVAATDVNAGRQNAAEALGLKWYASTEALLAASEIQAVYIATNNRSHVPLAVQALEAGKHVIVEKPLATSSADAQKLIDLAKTKGLSLYVDHMMVFNAWNQLAKTTVQGGQLGKVNDACFHMEFAYGYDPAEAATWRCSNIAEMGGPIGDVASHCFYVAEDILGSEVIKLAAVYLPKTMSIAAEDGAYIKAFFANGAQLSVKVAFSELRGGLAGTLGNLGFEIYGDQAVLRSYGSLFQISGHAGEPYQMHLMLDNGKGPFQELMPDVADIHNIYQSLIGKHAQSVLDGKPLAGGDALHNIRLCELAHQSAHQGGALLNV